MFEEFYSQAGEKSPEKGSSCWLDVVSINSWDLQALPSFPFDDLAMISGISVETYGDMLISIIVVVLYSNCKRDGRNHWKKSLTCDVPPNCAARY